MVEYQLEKRRISHVGESDNITNPENVWLNEARDWLNRHKGKLGESLSQVDAKFLYPLLLKYLNPSKGETILDAGSGEGLLAEKVRSESKANVMATDYVHAFLKADNNSTHRFVTNLIDNLPLQNECFDSIFSSMVLHWIPKINNFAEESQRILKPNGRLVVIVTHPFTAVAERVKNDDRLNPIIIQENHLHKGSFTRMINRTQGPFVLYQRTPFEYVRSFTDAGLSFVEGEDAILPEGVDVGPDTAIYQKFPCLLVMKFQKK